MGNEVSRYITALAGMIANNYAGWQVFERGSSSPRKTEDAWSVEIGVVPYKLIRSGNASRLEIQGEATVRYEAKATTHDSFGQAMDIAASMGAFMLNRRVSHQGEAHGELMESLEFETVAVYDDQGGQRVGTGRYVVRLTWSDRLIITPEIDIEGYVVTSPLASALSGYHDDSGPVIEEIDLRMLDQDGRELVRTSITEANP